MHSADSATTAWFLKTRGPLTSGCSQVCGRETFQNWREQICSDFPITYSNVVIFIRQCSDFRRENFCP